MRPGKDSSWRERVRPYVRVRHRFRSGTLLLRGGWLQILQTAVAACAAWFLSVLVLVVGVGALQAGLVVALAMALAVFLGREDVGVKEAAISAMITMITFHSPDSGLPLERFL